MDDSSYTATQLSAFNFPVSDGGSNNYGVDSYHDNMFAHPNNTDNLLISPAIDSRYDSVVLSPFQLPGSPVAQLHKADFQPDARLMTPHMDTGHLHRSADMSRENSYASYQSSISSGQHAFGGQQGHWNLNENPSNGASMRRTVSLHAGVSGQQLISPPAHRRVYSDYLGMGLTNAYSPASPVILLDDASSYGAPFKNRHINTNSTEIASRHCSELRIEDFGHL
ncbi:hypothetical protein E8E13_003526 [Curvularia kusanoi]|uniref:Uncharacterized protein n=1 Tax=Curvularia kusanoi TaxID=90978 RepID=A0A9P4WB97_CURKU|nr:hypothetical protein E8E13_003526 [Curvularia kusanoi]